MVYIQSVRDTIVKSNPVIWINHNSTLLLGIGILGAAAYFLLRDGFKARDALILAALFAAITGTWLAVRPRQSASGAVEHFQSQIGAGVPVLLEIQSPY